jgi:L-fuconolactonase
MLDLNKENKSMPEHESWLNLRQEEPVDPALPICDPHHHLFALPDRRYVLQDFLEDIGGGHNIVQTVFVEYGSMYNTDAAQGMQPVGETEFVRDITSENASGQYGTIRVAAGIIGFADLTLGAAVAPVLEAHIAASQRFRGVRHICTYDENHDIIRSASPRGLLLYPEFREGFSRLRDYNLSFDAWLYHTQLPELMDLARMYPDIPVILDHIGGPIGVGPYAVRREEVFGEWKRGITALAECSNVVVKLGGLGMSFCGFGWNERAVPPDSVELAEAMAPYYLWCIEKFGCDRCMFESNFPVDKRSYSYTVLWNAFKLITKGFSQDERAALFYGTASKTYRI